MVSDNFGFSGASWLRCDLSAAQIASLAAYHRQGFTYDKLGNRLTLSEPRDDATTTYTYDNVTNELATINIVSVTYDAAGNMTADHRGYTYEYDYENRLVKITEGPATIAEFTYDALGRRIVKVDNIASETTRYYYNADWQVLCEKDDSGDTQRWFVYGNYIDEVLLMVDTTGQSDVDYYYTSDHLYSPAALINASGTVLERYEYDAYGELRYLDADFTLKATQSSACDNPYYFTGRRLDVFDNGDLKLQHNRHRTYDPETGRWLTPDPRGIQPDGYQNSFKIKNQYGDGGNLYEYAQSNALMHSDALGLSFVYGGPMMMDDAGHSAVPPLARRRRCDTCGPDVTEALHSLERKVRSDFNHLSLGEQTAKCTGLWGGATWDITQLHDPDLLTQEGCGTGYCAQTVQVNGKCYSPHAVNYYLYGVMHDLCSIAPEKTVRIGSLWPLFLSGDYNCKRKWANAGIYGDLSGPECSTYSFCKKCSVAYTDPLGYKWERVEVWTPWGTY